MINILYHFFMEKQCGRGEESIDKEEQGFAGSNLTVQYIVACTFL
jgi:hypothetical protein